MKDRLNAILKHYKLSASQFADQIGVQRASVSHVLSERNKPGFDFIQKILDTYPSISAEWLITGKGEMMKSKISGSDLFSEADITIEEDNDSQKSGKRAPDVPLSHKEPIKRTVAGRNIEKIIVFYSDKSFGEYFPE